MLTYTNIYNLIQGVLLARYLVRRSLQVVPLILAVIVINFMIVHLAPGDPASALAGDIATPEYQEQLRQRFGLDKSLLEQLFIYLGNVLTGDLGYSFAYQKPVVGIILERLPATLLLMVGSLTSAIVGGTLLGALSAKHRGSWIDRAISFVTLGLYSVPVFWSGMVLILFFSLTLGWFPTSGMRDYGEEANVLSTLHHLALPTLALGLFTMPTFARLTRSAMLEVLDEDFVRTSRAIGYPSRVIYYRHALKNAALPTITVAGLSVGEMFSGALLTETVFAWPGMGQLMYQAVFQRDYPVLMGTFLVTAVAVAVCMIIADVCYSIADPRVRLARRPS